ncbi:hypothetical protein DFH09DRAFT_1275203 [Mycena vulgaris]|nr:hypothetical protein DFH09DRAFT_1275203 [Mycena vulgaris]
MPPQSTVTQIRLDTIATSLKAVVTTVEVISKELNTPFLAPIVTTMWSLLDTIQKIKKNKDVCTGMLEQVHKLLYGIIQVHIASNTSGELTPRMLNNLGQFAETLHKIHTFVEAQQEKIGFKMFFRQAEMTTLLKSCTSGIDQAVDVFMVNQLNVVNDISNMKEKAQHVHQEVLQLISGLSDDNNSDGGSFMGSVFSNSHHSSNSLTLLPPKPKIFHGREAELSAILELFRKEVPRISILGAGGMGKTSLSKAVLHHPALASRYDEYRLFVPCDTVSTSIQLAGLIGAYLGLKPGKDLTVPVIRHLSNGPPTLLILDNLETIWEPAESRADLEKFLCNLTDIEDLALITTMRGTERPAHVRWTRPFLESLKPLAQDAARQTFIDTADDIHRAEDIDTLLLLTDNLPLAIDLIANLVVSEGIPSVLSRWETQRTAILSEGYDVTSNLDLSISLSLSSRRLASSPDALELLSLLSMLPEGLSDVELLQSDLPLVNILACKSTLLRTALAYTDGQKRLKALVPIREYMQKNHPAHDHVIHAISVHYQELLELYRKYYGTLSSVGVIARVTANFANIQNVLLKRLSSDGPHLAGIISSSCELGRYSRTTGRGHLLLLHHIPKVLSQSTDHKLKAYFIIEKLSGRNYGSVHNANQLIHQALDHFKHFDDPDMKSEYHRATGDHVAGMQFCQSGLSLAISAGSLGRQSRALGQLARIKIYTGDFLGAKEAASKSQRVAKITGNVYIEASALQAEATCWQFFGSYSHCISLLTRAAHLLDLCGMSGGAVHTEIRTTQSEVCRCRSEYVEAHSHIHVYILNNTTVDQNPYYYAMALHNIAQIELEIGSSDDTVQRNLEGAHIIFTKINDLPGLVLCDILRAALYLRQGNSSAARHLFQHCLRSAWGKDLEAVTYCLEKLASGQQWSAADQISSHWPVILLVCSVRYKRILELHKALQFLGDVFQSQGDQETAINLFTVSLDRFTQMDVHRSRAECMIRLGDISNLKGDQLKAMDLWDKARPLFERSSQSKQLVELNSKLAGLCHNQSHEVQDETVDRLSKLSAAPNEHLEQLSGAAIANATVTEEMEKLALEKKKSPVLVDARI